MKRYICTNCGYVYDPALGDPLSNVPPGTAFEKLPEQWRCPICYVEKELFDELED